MNVTNYYFSEERHNEVISAIKPLCDLYKIKYEHIVNRSKENPEYLDDEYIKLNDTLICITFDSALAIESEVLGYVFIYRWCRYRSLGAFDIQSKNVIKRNWKKGKK